MHLNMVAIFFLVSASIGGLVWVFIYPILSGDRQAELRRQSVAQQDGGTRKVSSRNAQKSRREQVEATLKSVEERHKKAKTPPLPVRLEQAGLTWSKRAFFIVSAGMGFAAFVLPIFAGVNILVGLALGPLVGLAVPRWLLSFLKKRRERKFIEHFPDAIDTIVRGIKAGLPLLDSMRLIVADAPEPVRSEFKVLLDAQSVGMSMGDACGKLYEHIPLPEANFFGIVIAIQQKAGGNLSEALGNLSKVLRDRKKMKAKIRAMSQEAKASALIIGALPVVVSGAIYATSPDFITILFVHPIGQMMLAGCVVWMGMGVLVMKNMINFDF